MTKIKILIADDEATNREYLSEILLNEGYEVECASDGQAAIEMLSGDIFQVVLTDLNMPRLDGLEVIRHIKEHQINTTGIIYTGYGSVRSAVDAMKIGAFDYITKPFKAEEIKVVVDKALEHLRIREENIHLKEQLRTRYRFDNMVGSSDKMQRVFDLIGRIAGTDSIVLVLGDSGTGKELVAQAIHYNSPRAERPFVPVNCGAIPEALLESELFGHEKGAFTGAFRTRVGRFELAQGGSIFLDEISEMSPNLQVKLLRVLQEKEFERVGGIRSIKADVRIIAATNKNLDQEVRNGRFREDLFYRLNVIPLDLPPLKERRDDIPLLIRHFLDKYRAERSTIVDEFSKKAMNILMHYNWPGNVRELENLVERMAVLCDHSTVETRDLPEKILLGSANISTLIPYLELPDDGIDLSSTVGEFEKTIIVQALNRSNWVKNRAAKLLHINRTTLVEKIKKQKLEQSDFSEANQKMA
ncbi:MAG: sigma-54 dependent transcriptional regulator [Thermodesulfobacteriota bacterium]|nr:sigma-54 dependent transcriptional regulator [Thermodesulfobacteriota bacterium]